MGSSSLTGIFFHLDSEKSDFFFELDQSTCWSVFGGGGGGSPSYIQGALPQSSISKFDCWCWCHFSSASTGTAICMTPPRPQFTTNSLFNTFAKSPVCHTVFFNLLHFPPACWAVRLTWRGYSMLHFRGQMSLLVGKALVAYASRGGTVVKTYTLWNGNDCQTEFIGNVIYFMVHLMQACKGHREV